MNVNKGKKFIKTTLLNGKRYQLRGKEVCGIKMWGLQKKE